MPASGTAPSGDEQLGQEPATIFHAQPPHTMHECEMTLPLYQLEAPFAPPAAGKLVWRALLARRDKPRVYCARENIKLDQADAFAGKSGQALALARVLDPALHHAQAQLAVPALHGEAADVGVEPVAEALGQRVHAAAGLELQGGA